MATLNGNKIKDTYQGIIKTSDNAAIDGNLKNMTDGAGNATPLSMANNYVQLQAPTIELIESTGGSNLIQISATNTYFEGAVDFTNASVTGIGGGAAGLADSTGTFSIASTLTDQPGVASGYASMAIGRNADATNDSAIAIGNYSDATGSKAIAIGSEVTASAGNSISIGWNRSTGGSSAIGLGVASSANGSNAVQYGAYAGANGQGAVSLGWSAGASTTFSIGIGRLSNQSNSECIAIGNFSRANNLQSIAIGSSTAASADGAIALGRNITAAKVDTVSVTELETQLAGGGITMKSPDGTEYKLTVSNTGDIVIT